MNKLLSLIGSISLMGTPVATTIANVHDHNVRYDPIDKDTVSSEMIEIFEEMESITVNPSQITDINEVINILITATSMIDEVFDDSFFYALNTKLTEIANIFKDQLSKVMYQKDENFYEYILRFSQEISIEYQYRVKPEFKQLFQKYEKDKSDEARIIFKIHDKKITSLNFDLMKKQKELSDLNVRDEEISQELANINNENKIIQEIMDIVHVTEGYTNTFKGIYDNAMGLVQQNYDQAQWHSKNWGLGAIPFIGIGFNVSFQNRMNDTVKYMQLFTQTFSAAGGPNSKFQELNQMTESLNNLTEELKSIDPAQNDLIKLLLDKTGLNEGVVDGINTAIDEGIKAATSEVPGLDQAIKAVLNLLGALFNAYGLHEQFDGDFSMQYNKFKKTSKVVTDFVNNAYDTVENSLKSLNKKMTANNDCALKLRNELEMNEKRIDVLNSEIKGLMNDIDNENGIITKILNNYSFADNVYYWYANVIGDVDPLADSRGITIEQLQQQLHTKNEEKNTLFAELLNAISKSGETHLSKTIENLKVKNNYSNVIYDIMNQTEE